MKCTRPSAVSADGLTVAALAIHIAAADEHAARSCGAAFAAERSTALSSLFYHWGVLQKVVHAMAWVMRKAMRTSGSETLAAVTDSPFMTNAERIETLFLATLSRKPRTKEMDKFLAYVENGGAEAGATAPVPAERQKHVNQALADVFWILLNSSEFMLNH